MMMNYKGMSSWSIYKLGERRVVENKLYKKHIWPKNVMLRTLAMREVDSTFKNGKAAI